LVLISNACDSSTDRLATPSAASAAKGVTPSVVLTPKAALPALLPAIEKIYFEATKYETPDNTSRKLAGILAYAKVHDNSSLVISGFQDIAESSEPVLRLARQRSMAVRSVLISAGVAENRVTVVKAQESIAVVGAREANRVEVSISP
jgi:outer membrane protein OmpA-like peptidoglycan-associated protein